MRFACQRFGEHRRLPLKAASERSNESERCKPAVKLGRKLSDSARIALLCRCILGFKISPALVGTFGLRRNCDQKLRTDNVDPPVLAIFETKDFETGDQPVLQNPVEVTTDEFAGALWPDSGRDPDLAADAPVRESCLQCFKVATGKCDLRQMEFGHGLV